MKFRQFMEISQQPFTAKPYAANQLGLPDLYNLQKSNLTNVLGQQSFGQIAQDYQPPEDTYTLNLLKILASLATNIYEIIHTKLPAGQKPLYSGAYYDGQDLIGGIQRRDIEGTSGYGHRLDPNQMATAFQKNIIKTDPQDQSLLAIDLSVLKQEMSAIKQKSQKQGYIQGAASIADKIAGAASQGNLQLGPSVIGGSY